MERDSGLENIAIDDLKEQHRQYAEIIGIENLLSLAEAFGGSTIYIPQVSELLRNQKYGRIIEEYDGSNIKKLANKYSVSESTVYRLVKDRMQEVRARPLDNQIKLW